MSIIHNALSGALAAQAALSAASQNIANAMTPGYTRQGVVLGSVQPLQGRLSPGSGVAVSALQRFSDGYKSLQLWSAASELGQRSVAQTYFTQLEHVLGDDQSGINSGLDAFFAALNAASVEPTSSPLRQQVINAADALAQRMNAVSQLLASQRAAVAQQRIATVSQINGLAKDIADLNTQIVIANGTGINASGLIDTRDRKLDELASLVALQVVEQPDGSRSVALRGGQPLVVGGHAATVTAAFNADGSQSLSLSLAQEVFSLDDTALGGELGGLQELERDVLAPLMRSLAEMAQQLADNVNAQLAAGYTPDGAPGQPLFAVDISGDIGLLRINPNLGGADLAFSAVPGEPGNSDNLRALIALRDQPVTLSLLGSVTLSDAVTQLVGRLGMDSQQNQSALDTARAVRNQAEESWKSTSGVNLDEEAINLMQYQQMYESNMKVIAVANELFDSTLAMLR